MSKVEVVLIVRTAHIVFLEEIKQEHRDGHDVRVEVVILYLTFIKGFLIQLLRHVIHVPGKDFISTRFVSHLDTMSETFDG